MPTPFRLAAFRDLRLSRPGPKQGAGLSASDDCLTAEFRLDADISPLFPYIKAEFPDAMLLARPRFIRFVWEAHLCGLHPDRGAASPFRDAFAASEFIRRLIDYLRDLHARRHTIKPNPRTDRRPSVLDIYHLLPGTNCRECGYPTCLAFAAAVSQQHILPEECPGLGCPIAETAVYPLYDREGRMKTTVRISMDTARVRDNLKRQQERIADLENALRQTSSQPSPEMPLHLPAALTQRELEVLQLVAQGATNMEISQILYISPHTVKSHVIHIFNKLGVNDRTQAAVWAAKNHLV